MAPESATPQEGLPEESGTESEAESEAEEPEEVRRIAACRKPTRKQMEEHEETISSMLDAVGDYEL